MRVKSLVVCLGILAGMTIRAQDVIRAEKKLVLVDVVVTDKKGDYVRGLTAKDFRLAAEIEALPKKAFR